MKFLKIGEDMLLPINNEMIFKVRYYSSQSQDGSWTGAKLEVSYIDWPDERYVPVCDVSQIMLHGNVPKPRINELVELVFARRMVQSLEVRFS